MSIEVPKNPLQSDKSSSRSPRMFFGRRLSIAKKPAFSEVQHLYGNVQSANFERLISTQKESSLEWAERNHNHEKVKPSKVEMRTPAKFQPPLKSNKVKAEVVFGKRVSSSTRPAFSEVRHLYNNAENVTLQHMLIDEDVSSAEYLKIKAKYNKRNIDNKYNETSRPESDTFTQEHPCNHNINNNNNNNSINNINNTTNATPTTTSHNMNVSPQRTRTYIPSEQEKNLSIAERKHNARVGLLKTVMNKTGNAAMVKDGALATKANASVHKIPPRYIKTDDMHKLNLANNQSRLDGNEQMQNMVNTGVGMADRFAMLANSDDNNVALTSSNANTRSPFKAGRMMKMIQLESTGRSSVDIIDNTLVNIEDRGVASIASAINDITGMHAGREVDLNTQFNGSSYGFGNTNTIPFQSNQTDFYSQEQQEHMSRQTHSQIKNIDSNSVNQNSHNHGYSYQHQVNFHEDVVNNDFLHAYPAHDHTPSQNGSITNSHRSHADDEDEITSIRSDVRSGITQSSMPSMMINNDMTGNSNASIEMTSIGVSTLGSKSARDATEWSRLKESIRERDSYTYTNQDRYHHPLYNINNTNPQEIQTPKSQSQIKSIDDTGIYSVYAPSITTNPSVTTSAVPGMSNASASIASQSSTIPGGVSVSDYATVGLGGSNGGNIDVVPLPLHDRHYSDNAYNIVHDTNSATTASTTIVPKLELPKTSVSPTKFNAIKNINNKSESISRRTMTTRLSRDLGAPGSFTIAGNVGHGTNGSDRVKLLSESQKKKISQTIKRHKQQKKDIHVYRPPPDMEGIGTYQRRNTVNELSLQMLALQSLHTDIEGHAMNMSGTVGFEDSIESSLSHLTHPSVSASVSDAKASYNSSYETGDFDTVVRNNHSLEFGIDVDVNRSSNSHSLSHSKAHLSHYTDATRQSGSTFKNGSYLPINEENTTTTTMTNMIATKSDNTRLSSPSDLNSISTYREVYKSTTDRRREEDNANKAKWLHGPFRTTFGSKSAINYFDSLANKPVYLGSTGEYIANDNHNRGLTGIQPKDWILMRDAQSNTQVFNAVNKKNDNNSTDQINSEGITTIDVNSINYNNIVETFKSTQNGTLQVTSNININSGINSSINSFTDKKNKPIHAKPWQGGTSIPKKHQFGERLKTKAAK